MFLNVLSRFWIIYLFNTKCLSPYQSYTVYLSWYQGKVKLGQLRSADLVKFWFFSKIISILKKLLIFLMLPRDYCTLWPSLKSTGAQSRRVIKRARVLHARVILLITWHNACCHYFYCKKLLAAVQVVLKNRCLNFHFP